MVTDGLLAKVKPARLFYYLAGVSLGLATLILALLHPPFWDWQPAPLVAVGMDVIMLVLYLWGRGWWRVLGLGGLWLLFSACLFTPPGKLGQAQEAILAPRLVILFAALVVWALVSPLQGWVRRGLLAVALPSIVFSLYIWWQSAPVKSDFQPEYVTVDSQGRLLVTDYSNVVIRVFSPEGNLLAKLRTDDDLLAGKQAFRQPGPSEVEQLGPGTGTIGQPAREFRTCGLAADRQNHFYLLATRYRQLLQLDGDSGQILKRWDLPATYRAGTSCLALDERYIYVADQNKTGAILVFDRAKAEIVAQRDLPARPVAVSADGNGTLYSLLASYQVCKFEAFKDLQSLPVCWNLPAPQNPAVNPYRGLIASVGKLFISDQANSQIQIFDLTGKPLETFGQRGDTAGQLLLPQALALDASGNLIVADPGHYVLQRFKAGSWQFNGLWRALEDEEIE
jgi:hypothetical protein